MIGDLAMRNACVYPFVILNCFLRFLVCGNILKLGSGTRCFEEADWGHTCKGRLNLRPVLFLYKK
jgi:hypothetical protein